MSIKINENMSLENQVRVWIGNNKNPISAIANFSALINEHFDRLNWVGFYMWSSKHQKLLLNAFQGKVACIEIESGSGVCGTTFAKEKTIVVPDVDKFPGHITCDSDSKSEVVIPLIVDGKCYGVLDLDSPELNRFDVKTVNMLEKLVKILIEEVDITTIQK